MIFDLSTKYTQIDRDDRVNSIKKSFCLADNLQSCNQKATINQIYCFAIETLLNIAPIFLKQRNNVFLQERPFFF